MPRKITISVVSAILTLLTLTIIISANDGGHLGTFNTVPQVTFAQAQQKFTAKLTGNQEVPPTTSSGRGTANFNESVDGRTLNYRVTLNNISEFTAINLNIGKQGQIGPTIATLFRAKVPVFLPMIAGNITSDKLLGPLAGKQISDLIKMIKDGNMYTNVITIRSLHGEIRGQLLPSPL
jgi:CHRD domain